MHMNEVKFLVFILHEVLYLIMYVQGCNITNLILGLVLDSDVNDFQ